MNWKKKEVFEDMKNKIITGELAPGEWLTERELVEIYGISRTPVREVLWNLASAYLVNIVPDHGYQVRLFSLDEVIEIYNARQAIEGTCSRLACSSTDSDYMDRLLDIESELKALDAEKDPEKGDLIGNKVHEFVIEKSRNNYLIDFNKKVSSVSDFTRNILKRDGVAEAKAKFDHLEIIEALKNRDSQGAEAAMIKHLRESCKDAISNYCGI